MSVDQTNTIDAIGIDKSSGRVILTISDHLEWRNNEHLLLLQDKMNTYLRFVESGEILDTYPDSKGKNITISIVCRYAPDSQAVDFLNKVARVIETSGIELDHRVFDENS